MRLLSVFSGIVPMMPSKAFGQLPLYLAKCHQWQSKVVVTLQDDTPAITPESFNSNVDFTVVGRGTSPRKSSVLLAKEVALRARNTDVLLLYHLTAESIALCTLYKTLNPAGVCVLKLDMDRRGLAAFSTTARAKSKFLVHLMDLAPFDFATIETHEMWEALTRTAPRLLRERLHVLPVGFSHDGPAQSFEQLWAQKEPIVLTVGRLGIEQKQNELLLRAFSRIPPDDIGPWKLLLAGSRTRDLEAELARIAEQHPFHSSRIETIDFVESREALYDLYRRSRVYCLSSGWESYATVLNESAYFGCLLLTTPVGAAPSLTGEGLDGLLFPIGGEDALVAHLKRIFAGDPSLEGRARRSTQRVRTELSWRSVSATFANLVRRARLSRNP